MQSRYYNPEWGRFINADSTQVFEKLTNTQDDLLDVNLFAYCLNNPVNMIDLDGEFAWTLYFTPGVGQFLLAATLAIVAVTLTVVVIYRIAQIISKANRKEDSFARSGQKKQDREKKEKKKSDNKDWRGNPNKRKEPLKKHTPGRDHKKYPKK